VVRSRPGDSTRSPPRPAGDESVAWLCGCGELQPRAAPYCPRCDATSPRSVLGALLGSHTPVAASREPVRQWSRQRRLRQASVVLAIFVLVAAGAGVAVSARSARDRGDVPLVSNARLWSPDPTLRKLAGYVEQARGLQFRRPVAVNRLSERAFRTREPGTLLDLADARVQTATLRALGLVRGAAERAAESGARQTDVVGVYDIGTKQIYVRADLAGPYLRFVLVHELTHALQDQHFDLSRPYGDDGDAVRAAISLVEGDAQRVAESYLETLGAGDVDALQREALTRRDELFQGLYLRSADDFPYSAGAAFVRGLLERGGQAGLDAAFRSYPTSTEQVLHVERYLRGDQPVAVPEPPAPGAGVERGVLGEFELVSVLAAGGIDVTTATRAGEGWGGASYVTWLSGGRACVRVGIVMDTPADTDRLAAALRGWTALRRGAASVTGARPLTLTACERD